MLARARALCAHTRPHPLAHPISGCVARRSRKPRRRYGQPDVCQPDIDERSAEHLDCRAGVAFGRLGRIIPILQNKITRRRAEDSTSSTARRANAVRLFYRIGITRRRAADSTSSTARRANAVRLFCRIGITGCLKRLQAAYIHQHKG